MLQTNQSRAIAEYSGVVAPVLAATERMTSGPHDDAQLLEARATLVQGIAACMQHAPHPYPCGHTGVVLECDTDRVKRSLATIGRVTRRAKDVCGAHCTTTEVAASAPGNTKVEFTIEKRCVMC